MSRWLTILLAALATSCAAAPSSDAAAPARFDRLSNDPVVHGERLATVLGCSGCHGAALTGKDWSEPGFARIWTSNLTHAAPRYTDAQLARAIVGGVRFDGADLWDMPSHLFTALRPDEIAAIIAFVRSRPMAGVDHPPPRLEQGALQEIADGRYRSSRAEVVRAGADGPPDLGAVFARGRYIARATCAECHGHDLRGGTPYPGAAARPDLRIAAGYDATQFKRLLDTGVAIGERDVGLMSEVARGRYKHLTDAERDAVLAYLHRLAEVAP